MPTTKPKKGIVVAQEARCVDNIAFRRKFTKEGDRDGILELGSLYGYNH